MQNESTMADGVTETSISGSSLDSMYLAVAMATNPNGAAASAISASFDSSQAPSGAAATELDASYTAEHLDYDGISQTQTLSQLEYYRVLAERRGDTTTNKCVASSAVDNDDHSSSSQKENEPELQVSGLLDFSTSSLSQGRVAKNDPSSLVASPRLALAPAGQARILIPSSSSPSRSKSAPLSPSSAPQLQSAPQGETFTSALSRAKKQTRAQTIVTRLPRVEESPRPMQLSIPQFHTLTAESQSSSSHSGRSATTGSFSVTHETQSSNSQRSERWNNTYTPLPLSAPQPQPIVQGGITLESQSQPEEIEETQILNPVLVPASNPSSGRSRRSSSPRHLTQPSGYEFTGYCDETMDLHGAANPYSDIEPTQVLPTSDYEATQPLEPSLSRPYEDLEETMPLGYRQPPQHASRQGAVSRNVPQAPAFGLRRRVDPTAKDVQDIMAYSEGQAQPETSTKPQRGQEPARSPGENKFISTSSDSSLHLPGLYTPSASPSRPIASQTSAEEQVNVPYDPNTEATQVSDHPFIARAFTASPEERAEDEVVPDSQPERMEVDTEDDDDGPLLRHAFKAIESQETQMSRAVTRSPSSEAPNLPETFPRTHTQSSLPDSSALTSPTVAQSSVPSDHPLHPFGSETFVDPGPSRRRSRIKALVETEDELETDEDEFSLDDASDYEHKETQPDEPAPHVTTLPSRKRSAKAQGSRAPSNKRLRAGTTTESVRSATPAITIAKKIEPIQRLMRQGRQRNGSTRSAPKPTPTGKLVLYRQDQRWFAGYAVTAGKSRSKFFVSPCDDAAFMVDSTLDKMRKCEFRVGDGLFVLPDKASTPTRDSYGGAIIVGMDDWDEKRLLRVKFEGTAKHETAECDVGLAEISILHQRIDGWNDRTITLDEVKDTGMVPPANPNASASNHPVAHAVRPPASVSSTTTRTNTPKRKHPSRHASTSSSTKLFHGVGFLITGIKEDGYEKLEKAIIDRGGQMFVSWRGPFAFDGEIIKSPGGDRWASAEDSIKWVKEDGQAYKLTTLFTIARNAKHSANFIMSLALGVPCVHESWIWSCAQQGSIVPWKPYKLASSELDHPLIGSLLGDLNGAKCGTTQETHSHWAEDNGELLTNIMEELPWLRFLKDYQSVVYLNPCLKSIKKDMADGDDAQCNDPYAYCLLAAGAKKVQATDEAAAIPPRNWSGFDLILVKDSKVVLPRQAKCRVITTTQFKQSLAIGSLVPP